MGGVGAGPGRGLAWGMGAGAGEEGGDGFGVVDVQSYVWSGEKWVGCWQNKAFRW